MILRMGVVGNLGQFGLASAVHTSETGFHACAQHICVVETGMHCLFMQLLKMSLFLGVNAPLGIVSVSESVIHEKV
jgi:hypothetical protein